MRWWRLTDWLQSTIIEEHLKNAWICADLTDGSHRLIGFIISSGFMRSSDPHKKFHLMSFEIKTTTTTLLTLSIKMYHGKWWRYNEYGNMLLSLYILCKTWVKMLKLKICKLHYHGTHSSLWELLHCCVHIHLIKLFERGNMFMFVQSRDALICASHMCQKLKTNFVCLYIKVFKKKLKCIRMTLTHIFCWNNNRFEANDTEKYVRAHTHLIDNVNGNYVNNAGNFVLNPITKLES